MRERDPIVFIPHRQYAFEQQLATALYLAEQGGYKPHFLFMTAEDQESISQLEASGFPHSAYGPSGAKSAAIKHSSQSWNRRIRRLLERFASRLPGGRIALLSWQMWNETRAVRNLVQTLKPCCAVVSQERLRLFLPALKTLQKLKVPVIVMPAADSTPDGSAWMRRESYRHKAGLNKHVPAHNYFIGVKWGIAIFNRLVQRWLPSQVYHSPWGNMIFYSPDELLSLRIMGMLPRNPWHQGTTFADYIMISGSDEAAMYAEAGVDPGKLLLFGSHDLDVLYQLWLDSTEMRRKLFLDYRLKSDEPILMVALSPLWERSVVSEEVHWQSVNEVLAAVSRQDCNVVISLHPSMDPNDYLWVEEKYSVKIAKEPLKGILVAADIFVVTYSSTLRWAVALGVPVINLDLWGLGWDMYQGLSGFPTVTTIPEFEEQIRELMGTRKVGGHNGGSPALDDRVPVLADGKAKERLLQFIQSLDGDITEPVVPIPHNEKVR